MLQALSLSLRPESLAEVVCTMYYVSTYIVRSYNVCECMLCMFFNQCWWSFQVKSTFCHINSVYTSADCMAVNVLVLLLPHALVSHSSSRHHWNKNCS